MNKIGKIVYLAVIKIHAEGCNYRSMTIVLPNGELKSLRISQENYDILYQNGVPTSQYLRWHKNVK